MTNNKSKECPVPKGMLIIIGGKENKGKDGPEGKEKPNGFVPFEILKTFVELIKKDDPVVELVTSAGDSGNEYLDEYKGCFDKLGVKKLGHIHHANRQEILNENMLERIRQADALFFTGGDQLKLSSIYGGTAFLTELKKRYIHNKIIIAGTSAGAMAMSTPMIYAGNEEVHELGGEIKITTGLEFLKDVCIDTHFVHRGRFVRLAQVIATNPTTIGIGIEEDTAVIIRNGIEAEIIGSGTTIVIEGFHISESNITEFADKTPISIRNLKVHILSQGNTYQIPQTNPPHF
jgi:cyanophycinase